MVRALGKKVGRALLAAAVLIALLMGGLAGFLRSSWGSDFVRRTAEDTINASMRGALHVGRITLGPLTLGGTRIDLDGVELRGPDGERVGTIARLRIEWSLGDLLRRQLSLRLVEVQSPSLVLRTDAAGESNLARALASAKPATPRPDRPSSAARASGWTVQLGELRLVDGTLELRRPAAAAVAIDRIDVTTDGTFVDGQTSRFRVRLRGQAELRLPVREPVLIDLDAGGALAGSLLHGDGRVTLGVGQSRLQAHVSASALAVADGFPGTMPGSATVRLEDCTVAPAQLAAWLPSVEAKDVVHLDGKATWQSATRRLTVSLAATPSKTRAMQSTPATRVGIDLDAVAESGRVPWQAPWRLDELRVDLQHIDLADWLAQGPRSDLSVEAHAQGSGRSLADLRGSVVVRAPRGRMGGLPVGPVRLTARATGARYQLVALHGRLPGLEVEGHGDLRDATLALHLRLVAHDLRKTAKAVAAANQVRPLPLAGRGWARLDVHGAPRAPGVRVAGFFSDLRFGDNRASALRLFALVPDVRRPLAADATIAIPEARAGGRWWRGLAIRLRSAGSRLDLRLGLQSPEHLRVVAAGLWQKGHRTLDLRRLDIGHDGATWTLARPTLLAWHDKRLRVEDLELRASRDESLHLTLQLADGFVLARLLLHGLELRRLPARLLPEGWSVRGRLDAELQARGRLDNPHLQASLRVHRGRLGDLAVEASLDGRLRSRRAAGRLHLRTLGGNLDGDFDVPLAKSGGPAMRVGLDLRAFGLEQLAALAALAGRPVPDVRGTVSASLDVHGTFARPVVAVTVHGTQVVIKDCILGAIALHADSKPGGPATASLRIAPATTSTTVGAGACLENADFTLRSGLSVEALLARAGRTRRLRSAAHHVEGSVHGLDLAALAKLVGKPSTYQGRADANVALDGSVAAPQGNIHVRLADLRSAVIPSTDALLDAQLSRHELRGHARIHRKGTSLVVVDAVARSTTSILQHAGFEKATLRAHAEVGPIQFQHSSLSVMGSQASDATLRATARAVLDVEGTLANPRASFHAEAGDVRLGDRIWGMGQVDLTYATGKAALLLHLRDRGGGSLDMRSGMNVDLGYPQIAKPIAWNRRGLEGRMDARSLDVSALSALSPAWHDVSGTLTGEVTWSGSLADPLLAGQIALEDGAVTVTNVGQYKNIHLVARGDRQHVTIDELKLASGEGSATLVGRGVHVAGGYAVDGTIAIDKLPMYSDGQKVASVSLQATAKVNSASSALKAEANVKSARIDMNDGKKKHIPNAARPADVVVVRPGQAPSPQSRTAESVRLSAQAPRTKPPAVPVAAPALVVRAPRNLWINGKDASVEIGLEPGFRVEWTQPARIYGTVVVKRGRIGVLGRRFDLKADSTIRFQGPADAPDLDVTAQYVNDQQQITVVATVKGVPQHLATTLTAPDHPELTESQLYTLIVTGRSSFSEGPAGSATPVSQAGSVLGGLLAGQLQKVVAKTLPFDVLTIEGGDTMGSAKVEAGTYVTSDVYVGYVGRLGVDPTLAQNRNAVHLEYLLGSRWSFQGEYGDAKAGSADVVWTKHY